jgi:ATP-binding cassette, subfamily B, bacterial CvaB/MchF/RaxB
VDSGTVIYALWPVANVNLLDQLNLGWTPRLPLVLQTEAAECGLACLTMFANYLGYQIDLVELRRQAGLSLRGATLKDLMRIADEMGISSRPIRLELEEMPMLKTPSILHWDLNHFVVLKSIGHNSLVIHDPAVGVRRMTLSEASKHFTGVALELTPTSTFQPAQAPPRIKVRTLLGRIVGLKRSLLYLLSMALAIEVFAMAGPLFIQWVVDHALVTADQDLLAVLALGFALLVILRISFEAMRSWMLIALSSTLKVQSRANLFTHLVNLPASYFEARHLGDIMSRFGSQETILQAITTDVVEACLDGLMAMLTLVIMFVFAPTLAAIVCVGAGLYALLRIVSYTPLRQASMEAIVWAARRDSHFLETLRGIKTIKLRNGQEPRRARWLNLLVETVNRQITTQKLQLLFRAARSLVMNGLHIIVVWLGAKLVLAGQQFSVGMLIAFLAYKDQFLRHITELVNKVVDLYLLRLQAERLADIVLTEPEARDGVVLRDRTLDPAAIEVRDLHFRYSDNDPWILNGVSFRIGPGESVAIVGASGCGKTTLLKVLASVLRPTHGEIRIDDEPLAHVGTINYRKMIGVVMQDDHLFAGSIADNICFFADQPDLQRIAECANAAAVHDDIAAMPMGYSTLIGDMGTVLSGGQKQRVLIARALYDKPRILLFDEATSHLDIERERIVNAAIRELSVTRIIVAHRPETIRSAHRVIVLDKGRVAQDLPTLTDASELPSLLLKLFGA